MEKVERINAVMVYSTQKVGLAQHSLHTIDVDRRRNCYSCGGFGHLAWNYRRQIIGQERRIEYENNQNNEQSNLNGKGDLIVLNYVSIIITDLQCSLR